MVKHLYLIGTVGSLDPDFAARFLVPLDLGLFGYTFAVSYAGGSAYARTEFHVCAGIDPHWFREAGPLEGYTPEPVSKHKAKVLYVRHLIGPKHKIKRSG